MKTFLSGVVFAAFAGASSLALAQMGMEEGTHGYGGMAGYAGLWAVYALVKAGVVLFGLWLLLRMTRAVERLADSKTQKGA